MPEGHTLFRLARSLTGAFAGDVVESSSPQGKFTDSAARVDGRVLVSAESVGKHLLVRFDSGDVVHIHLGLYGRFDVHPAPAVPPRGQVRWRLVGPRSYADLRGATTSELLEPPGEALLLGRLGPDPLRRKADPEVAWHRIERSRVSIAPLLMDQSVLAGVGNVYRAEILFRHRIDPMLPGKALTHEQWQAMWDDLRVLMKAGVRSGRIVTTLPEHRERRSGSARRIDAHYVYRRAGLPCRICGTPIATAELVGRNLYWCPTCQAS